MGKWMKKMWYKYSEILFRLFFFLKKKILLCDEPEKQYAKWNKLDRERQILLGIFYKQNLQKKLKSKKKSWSHKNRENGAHQGWGE